MRNAQHHPLQSVIIEGFAFQRHPSSIRRCISGSLCLRSRVPFSDSLYPPSRQISTSSSANSCSLVSDEWYNSETGTSEPSVSIWSIGGRAATDMGPLTTALMQVITDQASRSGSRKLWSSKGYEPLEPLVQRRLILVVHL